jgi:hypothetical protein
MVVRRTTGAPMLFGDALAAAPRALRGAAAGELASDRGTEPEPL